MHFAFSTILSMSSLAVGTLAITIPAAIGERQGGEVKVCSSGLFSNLQCCSKIALGVGAIDCANRKLSFHFTGITSANDCFSVEGPSRQI